MKTVDSWNEVVTYAECPRCQSTVALGSDAKWSGLLIEAECDECKQDFNVRPPQASQGEKS